MEDLLFKFDSTNCEVQSLEDSLCSQGETGALNLSVDFDRAQISHVAQGGYHLHTGNVVVDFMYPIFEGTAARIEGSKSSGKTLLSLNAAKRFLATGNDCHVIYFNSNLSEAKKAQQLVGDTSKRFLAIVPKDAASDSSVYMNVLAAAKHAIGMKKQGKRVLMIVDNLQSPLTASLQISKDLGSIFVDLTY